MIEALKNHSIMTTFSEFKLKATFVPSFTDIAAVVIYVGAMRENPSDTYAKATREILIADQRCVK